MAPGLRILLVEDEVIIRKVEEKFLTTAGNEVVGVGNGEDAVKAYSSAEKPFDFVLLDIELGRGMDGIATARAILDVRHVPILFVSSHTESEFVLRTEGIDSYGFVDKGSGHAMLATCIRSSYRLYLRHVELEERQRQIALGEERYRLLHEELGLSVGYYDKAGTVISCNKIAAADMGGRPEDFTGRKLPELFPGEEGQRYLRRISDAIAGKGTSVFEDRVGLPGGDISFRRVFSVVRNSSKEALGVQIVSQRLP